MCQETLTIDLLASKIMNLTRELKLNVVLKVESSQEVKNRELLLPEQSLENLKFFFLMRQLQLWMKTPRNRSKRPSIISRLAVPWSLSLIEWVLLRSATRSSYLKVEQLKRLAPSVLSSRPEDSSLSLHRLKSEHWLLKNIELTCH